MNIKLNLIEDLYAFIEAAQKHPSEVTLSQGAYTVDGKSVLGVFALNLSEVVKCHTNDGNYDDFERFAY